LLFFYSIYSLFVHLLQNANLSPVVAVLFSHWVL